MRLAHRARGPRAKPFRFNRRRVSVTGAVLAAAVGALLGNGSAIAATAPSAPAPSYLFSIPTASGTLTGAKGGQLTLRLTGARDYLTRFTNRPLRDASVVANVDFARRFKTYFANSAPNAVLTYTPLGARIPVSIVLTIGHPRWNADRDTWTFSARRIRRQPDDVPGTSIDINPPPIPNPRTFKTATLLIDGSSPTVGNPADLSGDGIATSLSQSLQQLFATTLSGDAGDRLSLRLGVDYSYALAAPAGAATSTATVPVVLANIAPFDPTTDLRVQSQSPLCNLESSIIRWQDATLPASGAYSFDLAVRSPDQPTYAEVLRYPSGSGALVSAGCSASL